MAEHPFHQIESVDVALDKGARLYTGGDNEGILKAALDDYAEKGMVFISTVEMGGRPYLVFRVTPS